MKRSVLVPVTVFTARRTSQTAFGSPSNLHVAERPEHDPETLVAPETLDPLRLWGRGIEEKRLLLRTGCLPEAPRLQELHGPLLLQSLRARRDRYECGARRATSHGGRTGSPRPPR